MNISDTHNAAAGSWIKETFRGDRSLGFVKNIDLRTNMMLVHFPKVHNSTWLSWRNNGQYKVINL
mgnify:CR=1 FL=1|jgi:hypothetical protein